jgi:hypothetical protein
MHTGSTTISFGASLVTIAAHSRAIPFAIECIGAITVFCWVLNAAVATNQSVISVAPSIGFARPQSVVPVVRVVVVPVVSVSVIVVPVPVVIIVVAVSVDDGSVDVGVVVVVDVAAPTAASPVTSPCTKTPGSSAAEASTNKTAAAECCANCHARAKGNAGRDRHRWRIRGHKEGRAVDDCRILLRDINDATVCWFNDDRLRALLHHFDLR